MDSSLKKGSFRTGGKNCEAEGEKLKTGGTTGDILVWGWGRERDPLGHKEDSKTGGLEHNVRKLVATGWNERGGKNNKANGCTRFGEV